MRKLSIIAWLGLAVLAGCGGSASSLRNQTSTTTGTGTTTTTDPVTTVTVVSNLATIAADGSNSASISATAKDANNNLVSGATVSFAASAGGLAITQATTDTNGLATATLTAGSAATGTVITITGSVGTVSGKATVTVGTSQQTISVITSVPQIPSDSSTAATITALVRDAHNVAVAGVTVGFAADSGKLTVTQATTDANGQAKATLDAGGDPTNRTVTVTVTAGAGSATVPVSVVGTKLSVSGAASLVQNSSGTFTLVLTNAGDAGIANQAVTLKSALGNTLSATSVTTDATGQTTFTLTAANAGTDTVTAATLGLQATASVIISSQSFVITAPAASAQVNIGTPTAVTVTWTAGGAPQASQTVNFSATRGTLSAASTVTSSTGTATVMVTSNSAGPAVISATGAGVSAQVTIEFIATTPAALNLQASPSTIAAQAQSTIIATVTDATGNLVEGKPVSFQITNDPTGGSLSVASSTTNAQGQASTVYTATTTTSALNGVQISATVPGGATTVQGSTSLTVGGQAVFLSLGTGNSVAAYSTTQYELPYTVQAVDAAGNGVNNIAVAFTVTSVAFVQGDSVYSGTSWQRASSTSASDRDAYNHTAACAPGYETINGVNTLVPGSVASTDVGTATTANGGSALVNLIYPKDHALWVAVTLTATATVSGTQSTTSATFYLPGLAADFTSATVDPPGKFSPYGDQATCLVAN